MMKDFGRSFYLLPLYLLPLLSVGQTQYKQVALEQHTLHIAEWGRKEGLPNRHVGGFFQDSRGIVWLQSINHFVRFDGQHFQVVQTQENPHPFLGVQNPFHQVDIREDIHHNIWRYFRANGQITVYNPTEDRHYSLQEYLGTETYPIIPPFARMISMDSILYFINNQKGEIFRYDGQLRPCFTDTQRAPEPLPGYEIHYFPAPDNRYWVIPQSGNTTLCNERGEVIETYPTLAPNNSFLSSGNRLYFTKMDPTNPSTLAVYEASQTAFTPTSWPPSRCEFIRSFQTNNPEPDNFFQIISDRWNRLQLITSEGKLVDLYPLLKAALDREYGLNGTTWYGAPALPCQTADGSIWINGGAGLIQISILPLKRFQSFFPSHSFRSLAWTGSADNLLGTSIKQGVEMLNRFQINTKVVTPFPGLNTIGSPYTITVLNKQVWLGYVDGPLVCYDQNGGFRRSYPLLDSINQPHPHGLHIQPDGKLVYCSHQGIVELDTLSGKSRYILEGVRANALFEDSGGQWWAGTERGMYHLGSKTFYLDSLASGKPLDVTHIHEDPDHYFWLATRQGLVRWKPWAKDYAHYTTEDGLSNDVLHAVYPGGHDWLWLSSNSGIMAFNRHTYAIQKFFEEDGLANNEQNFLAHGRGPDGWLYFGSVNGITRFDPAVIPSPAKEELFTQIFLDTITYFASGSNHLLHQGLLSEFNEPFYLPVNTEQLHLAIVHPQFGLTKEPVLEWRISKLSPQWTYLEKGKGILINGLPAGSFQLQIRIRDLATNSSAMVMSIPFQKAIYFYQYSWFWLFIVVLAGLTSWLIIRWRTRVVKARNLQLQVAIKEKTQELEHSNRNIMRQKEQLERINASKNQLFNNISHEFRTPLTLIQGYSDSLLAAPAQERIDVIKPATRIKEQALNLNRMIEEIMDLSRVQQGNIQLTQEPVEWTAFLQREFYLFEEQAQHKQLDYRLSIEPDAKTYLAIDTQKMERILHNLISNAIKFTPTAGRILVRCTIRAEEVEVVVADTGPGITPEEQAQIFDRYFQGSAARQMAQPGYGIGLALCQEYTQLMNGRLWVESLPGEGTSFFLVFPKELVTAQAAYPGEQPPGATAQPRTLAHLLPTEGQRHLLVVEDNAHVLEFLMEVLAEEYRLSTATNGEEALAVLEREPDIDLILSDVMMPLMDGYTLLQKTRSHPVWGFIPFMMLTALTADEGKLQALRLGVDAFLTKPFELVELKTQLQNLIRNQELRKAFLRQPAAASSQKKAMDTSVPVVSARAQEEQPKEESYDEQWMNELQATVVKNMARFDFKVSDLAFQMHISERTLRNYLKKYTGLAPSEFLQKARLDRAYQLAKEKKYRTIGEIAYAVGFKDAKHFSKLFRKKFGKTPSDYLS